MKNKKEDAIYKIQLEITKYLFIIIIQIHLYIKKSFTFKSIYMFALEII
jgi:hypothetical protein